MKRVWGSPIRRLLSREKTPLCTTCRCVFSAPSGRITRLDRANYYAPLFSVVVVSAPHLVRTSHPSGSRPREAVPSCGLPPRPWPYLAPENRRYHTASTEGDQIYGLPEGSNPWLAHGIGVPVIARAHARPIVGWDRGHQIWWLSTNP